MGNEYLEKLPWSPLTNGIMLKYPNDNARYVWKYFDSQCSAKSPQTEAAAAKDKPLTEDFHIMCWCCKTDIKLLRFFLCG